MTEQLSVSNPKEVPKHRDALQEKYDQEPKKVEKDLTSETAKLPKPTGCRLLVLPFKMKEKTKGGILITDDVIERSQVASTCGLVLEVGPDAYKDKERYPKGPWCKKGSWVVLILRSVQISPTGLVCTTVPLEIFLCHDRPTVLT